MTEARAIACAVLEFCRHKDARRHFPTEEFLREVGEQTGATPDQVVGITRALIQRHLLWCSRSRDGRRMHVMWAVKEDRALDRVEPLPPLEEVTK